MTGFAMAVCELGLLHLELISLDQTKRLIQKQVNIIMKDGRRCLQAGSKRVRCEMSVNE